MQQWDIFQIRICEKTTSHDKLKNTLVVTIPASKYLRIFDIIIYEYSKKEKNIKDGIQIVGSDVRWPHCGDLLAIVVKNILTNIYKSKAVAEIDSPD